jgi:hypothetical protein
MPNKSQDIIRLMFSWKVVPSETDRQIEREEKYKALFVKP